MAGQKGSRLCNESQEMYGDDVFPFFGIEDDELENIERKIEFCVADEYRRAHWKRQHEKRYSKPSVRIGHNITMAMYHSLKGKKRGQHWEDLVGYTLDDLVKRLKKTLPKGVTWEDFIENRNKYHVDHIIPLSAFNFETADDLDFKKAWALSNLQVLTAKDNLNKMAKITKPFQPSLLLRMT